MPNRRHVLSLIAVAAIVATSTAACAANPPVVDMQVVDRNESRVLPLWRHGGDAFIAGQPGNRYALRLTNRSRERVMVVLSVDGVNAITGDTATVSQDGYVLNPWETYDVIGWRKTNADAAAFYFTALSDSYAGRTGRPDNVGVIGAAVFRERVQPRPVSHNAFEGAARAEDRSDTPSRDAAKPGPSESRTRVAPQAPNGSTGAQATTPPPQAPSPRAAMADAVGTRRERAPERLGTGHGEREYSPIVSVNFERASSRPDAIIRIRYDSYERLLASGVVPRPMAETMPNPFPRFVPDPR